MTSAELRAALGDPDLDLTKVAKHAGLSRRTLERLRSGTNEPHASTVRLLKESIAWAKSRPGKPGVTKLPQS